MGGIIDATGISGNLDAKNLVMQVLQKGIALSNLQSICQKVSVPELTATIPVSAAPSVDEDVEEMELSEIETGAFTKVDFSLKKDRVKLAVSDEAGYKSKAGDPLAIQSTGAGLQLASILDKKIVAALETSPQTHATFTGGVWSTSSINPLIDLGQAVAGILPYKADFVVMTSEVYGYYLGNDLIKTAGTGNPAAFAGAVAKVPGLNLDIFVSDYLTAHSVMVGSSTGFAAVIGNGPVKVRSWDDESMGARAYQIDVFRQVKAPIFLNSSSLNMAAYQITAVIS